MPAAAVRPRAAALLTALPLAAASCSATAQLAIRDVEISRPRPFGYSVGDRIEHRVDLTLNHPSRLDLERLPPPGRIDRWLRFEPPQIDIQPLDDATRYRLRLSYQLVNLDADVEQLQTPQLTLIYHDGQGRFALPVNAWSFRASTLTDPTRRDLRPDRPPPPAAPPRALWFWSAAALLTLALAALTYRLLSARRARRDDPFLRAARTLGQLSHEADTPARERRALNTVQRAFSQLAGRALFADDLPQLFREQPRLLPLRQPIEQFFAHSRRARFDAAATTFRYSLDALAGLCRACHEQRRRPPRRYRR